MREHKFYEEVGRRKTRGSDANTHRSAREAVSKAVDLIREVNERADVDEKEYKRRSALDRKYAKAADALLSEPNEKTLAKFIKARGEFYAGLVGPPPYDKREEASLLAVMACAEHFGIDCQKPHDLTVDEEAVSELERRHLEGT